MREKKPQLLVKIFFEIVLQILTVHRGECIKFRPCTFLIKHFEREITLIINTGCWLKELFVLIFLQTYFISMYAEKSKYPLLNIRYPSFEQDSIYLYPILHGHSGSRKKTKSWKIYRQTDRRTDGRRTTGDQKSSGEL